MKKKKMRLTRVFLIFSGVIALVMCVLLGAASLYFYRGDVMERYEEIAAMAVGVAAGSLNGDDVRESIDQNEMNAGLVKSLELMNSIKESSNIAYMYMLYFPDKDRPDLLKYVLYANTDHDREKGIADSVINAEAGDEYVPKLKQAFYEMQFGDNDEIQYMVNLYKGIDTIEPVITAFKLVRDSGGAPVCIIGADIYASIVTKHARSYLIWVAFIGLAVFIIGLLGYSAISRKYIIRPIVALADCAASFVEQTKNAATPSDISYDVVEVKQNTEIRDLAEGLADMMASTKAYMIDLKKVTAEKERISAELSVATQIQADMLPRTFPAYPEREEFTVFASMDPAKEVGGDFYDFFFIDNDHFAMVMADVSGKGVPAALFMVIAKALIKNCAQSRKEYTPAQILYEVNNQLCEGNDAELFVTVWLAIIDINSGKGMAANAGHEHPVIRRAGGEYELVVYRHSPAVATMEGLRFREHEFELKPGDKLYVYTDGVAEATNASNELYGTERMLNALNKDPDAEAKKLLKTVRKDIDEFVQDAPQFDDITMLCFDYHGPGKKEGEAKEEGEKEQ